MRGMVNRIAKHINKSRGAGEQKAEWLFETWVGSTNFEVKKMWELCLGYKDMADAPRASSESAKQIT